MDNLPITDNNRIIKNNNMIAPRNNDILPISAGARGHVMNMLKDDNLSYRAKSIMTANPKSPFTIMKPLKPNTLDMEAAERQKELASQRRGRRFNIVVQR